MNGMNWSEASGASYGRSYGRRFSPETLCVRPVRAASPNVCRKIDPSLSHVRVISLLDRQINLGLSNSLAFRKNFLPDGDALAEKGPEAVSLRNIFRAHGAR